MADDNESHHFRVKTAPRHSKSSTSRSRQSYGSYETGESSADASALYDSSPRVIDPDANDNARNKRRSYRPRPSGGFLLPNPVASDRPARPREKTLPRQDGARRRSKIPVDSRRKGKSPVGATSDRSDSGSSSTFDMGTDTRDMEGEYAGSRHRQERRPSPSARPMSSSRIPSPRPNTGSLDMDSTQIVNMALNLSESRRMAQRRHVSTPAPPRLTPVPDSPSGGGLKQHLQQQRRTSRNLSPQPEKNPPLRNISASNPRVNSPLHQATFDPDGNYTYHFSASTLNRAQKAKEHFELMAQHRRLLQLIPPLDQGVQQNSRPSTSSVPNSPTASTSPHNPFNSNSYVPLGRPYNPLQYIRNRKVRARERRAMDGEAQGFSDVSKVTDWVDQAAGHAAASPFMPGPPSIPPFAGAQMPPGSQQQPSSIPVPVSATAKPKRPRIDWMIDPADMLADVNWLEQDDHKYLIEDRHYARIFPTPMAASSKPLSHQGEESAASSLRARQSIEHGHDDISIEPKPSDSNTISKADTDLSHTSARERARHKLHELRGMHHRHNSSVHSHHDFLNFRRSSFSDTSESETDRKRRGRSGTVSADSKAVLEKQMNEMMALEALEDRKRSLDEESDDRKQIHPINMTPDGSSDPSAQGHTRTGPRAEDSGDPEKTMRGRSSPVRSFRSSLEVPGFGSRFSMDLDSSAPPSPDLKPVKRRNNFMSGIGMDPSPPGSRPSSPARNPFSRVKSMFRDRSRDREREKDRLDQVSTIKEEGSGSPIEPVPSSTLSLSTESLGIVGKRSRSRSPAPKMPSRATGESHKSHKSIGSLRLGRDDQIGLRTIFKGGAKIDGIIRGGVSKVSDLLWKKDQDDDGSTSDTSSDESEKGLSKGRAGGSEAISQTESTLPQENKQVKNYLDVMPTFKPASDVEKPASSEGGALDVPVDISPPSRRSSRFDKLKPPRIDVVNASPVSSAMAQLNNVDPFVSDVSESELEERRKAQVVDDVRKSSGQLNDAVMTAPALSKRQRDSLAGSRHWSISDQSPILQRKTQLSKPEAARIRALVLSSGIKAMEIARRFEEPRALSTLQGTPAGLSWDDLSRFTPAEQANLAVSQRDLYATSARILSSGVEASSFTLEKQMHSFAQNEVRHLHGRADALHQRIATELIDMTRRAADDADECSRDINDGQRLKVKHVLDVIDNLMRRKRRRFRWARRGGWLLVEWALVGLMWYVWFIVTIARIFMGVGSGIIGVVRWLLWL
ncbi:hypothetical protein PG996_005870 [Apiospora saccharicola]|uniref:Uncharacterized protein n=1 Tax=Apiospora saccharicola TaxID=335842 RepID=A0ABR1VMY5_9PEZI